MADILGFPFSARPGDTYDTMPSECNPNDGPDVPIEARVLREAERLICDDRAKQHGAEQNIISTANLWSWWLGTKVTPYDVCMLNGLQKISRAKHGSSNIDNNVDIAGWIGGLAGKHLNAR